MAIAIRIDPELAARSDEELKSLVDTQSGVIDGLEHELRSLEKGIVGAFSTDVEEGLELYRRRDELPFRIWDAKIKKAQIDMALCDVRIRAAEPSTAKAFAEVESKQKALARAQEAYDQAINSWKALDGDQRDRQSRLNELARSISDIEVERTRRLNKKAA